jgi:hypothetical protein
MPNVESNPTYVCLEGLKEGNRFYTGYTEGSDPTKLASGEVAYKVLGYADTGDEARRILGYGNDPEIDRQRIADYIYKTGRGTFDQETCDRLSKVLNLGYQGRD